MTEKSFAEKLAEKLGASKPEPEPEQTHELSLEEVQAIHHPPPRLGIHRMDQRVRLPERKWVTDIGLDIFAHLLTEHGRDSNKMLPRYTAVAIPTGLVVVPPPGYYCQICSRSGWALQGVFVANSPGIIDPDYTGELKIILYNGSHETKYISHGQRIAQLVLCPIVTAEIHHLPDPPIPVDRGIAGFGSTGL